MWSQTVKRLAAECGFELSGVSAAESLPEADYYREWVAAGFAGEMGYLTDHRAAVRSSPKKLLPSARSVISVGKLYNGPEPNLGQLEGNESGWISRYAWGRDYHEILRSGLRRLVQKLEESLSEPFQWKICVDTAPLLERAYARRAGLGWIGKNTCLINQEKGSWFFLGELLVSIPIEPDEPPPDRCGSCTLCIDACPTAAIVPTGRPEGPSHAVDSRRCIAYSTIELRSAIPEDTRAGIGSHVFGCDICQDVCPWNARAPVTQEPGFAAEHFAPPLRELASLTEGQFRQIFRESPVMRARYTGFLRNVAVAMGNQRLEKFREPLEELARSPEPLVAESACWALRQLS